MEGGQYSEDLRPKISKKRVNQGLTMRCIETIFELVAALNEKSGKDQRKY